MKLQGACESFLSHCRSAVSLSEHTLRAYTFDLLDFQNHAKRDTDFVSLDKENLRQFIRHLREERKLKETTIKRRIACLKLTFTISASTLCKPPPTTPIVGYANEPEALQPQMLAQIQIPSPHRKSRPRIFHSHAENFPSLSAFPQICSTHQKFHHLSHATASSHPLSFQMDRDTAFANEFYGPSVDLLLGRLMILDRF